MTTAATKLATVQPDLEMAQEFLARLDPAGIFTFQTYTDKASDSPKNGNRGDPLAKILHGTLDQHREKLLSLHEKGAGVFVMVNAGDGAGRSAHNVNRVRAVFVDLDGAPLQPVLSCEAAPHIVVESSSGRWHAYWLVSDCPLDAFRPMQKAIMARFDGDISVHDLPRVLRLPGFLHRKAEPQLVRLEGTPRQMPSVASYPIAALRAVFSEPRETSATTIAPMVGVSSDSNEPFSRICGDGDRTLHLTQSAGALIRKGLPLHQVVTIAKDWNTRNTPPLDMDKVESTCASIQRTHQRNHPELTHRSTSAEVIPLFPRSEARIDRYLEREPAPRRWLLTDCLPQGKVGALIAPGGTGKSQFLLQLAVSVATGQPFLTWSIGEPGGVLCLFAEDDDEEIHRRFHRIYCRMTCSSAVDDEALKRLKENLHIRSMVGLDNLMTIADRGTGEVRPTDYAERLILVAQEIPNLRLIVIDPGSRFRGGDENVAQDTTRFIEVMEKVSRCTGANVLVAHHANKGSMQAGEASQSAQRGSSAFTDGVRWQMNLSYLSEKEQRQFNIDANEKRLYLTAAVTKNNYGPPGSDLVLHREEDGLLVPANVVLEPTASDAELLRKVKSRLILEMRAGAIYTRSRFEESFGGIKGEFKIGKNALRTKLSQWIKNKQLVIGTKNGLFPDSTMASRYVALSEKIAEQTMH